MIEASENMEYEEAAKYRDQIKALEVISEKQKVVSQAGIDQDVIGSAIGIDEACIQIFFIRNGNYRQRALFAYEYRK